MIAGGNWWRANEIVIRHLTLRTETRYRCRDKALEGLGWRFHRIWSTDWLHIPAKQAEALRGVISDRLAELKAQEAQFTRRCGGNATNSNSAAAAAAPSTPSSKVDHDQREVKRPAVVESRAHSDRVSIGDTVRVRYLTDDK